MEVLGSQWRPRRTNFNLGASAILVHTAEPFGVHNGDTATRCDQLGRLLLERFGQPTPADAGQHRVCRHLRIDVCAGERDATKGAVPCLIARRIVQQDKPTFTQIVMPDDDIASNGIGERGDPLRCGHFFGNDFGTQDSMTNLLHCRDELCGSAVYIGARTHRIQTKRERWEPPAVTRPMTCEDSTVTSLERSLTHDSAFLRAARGQDVPHTPVWFMRQAGRSLPEYRALRAGTNMLDACFRPDMVVEITLQPVRRYDVDAAIFFSDIVVPLKAIGVDLDIVAGTGPVIADPVSSPSQLRQLRDIDSADVVPIVESIRAIVADLGSTPLIGFAGAPFTLASYLIEGGPSKDHRKTKAMMYGNPELWHGLLGRLAAIAAQFLRVQVEAGASAVQLFDSWAGVLSLSDYDTYVKPHSRAVLEAVADLGVPRIHFGVGTGELLQSMGDAGADVVGVDWRLPLDVATRRIGGGRAVQGNLDSTAVFAPTEVMCAKAADVIEAGRSAPGHIFNLGHGVLPDTDPDALARLVDFVHGYERV